MANFSPVFFWTDNDLHVSAEAHQAFKHLGLTDPTKLPAEHLGELGYRVSRPLGYNFVLGLGSLQASETNQKKALALSV